MSEWEWNPDAYLATMAAEIPGYEELQQAVVAATRGITATRVLELGTGTGETALRVRAEHPDADWVGIDSSEPMLARASERLPDADLRLRRLEDALPAGPFDLVVSALAVHHLDGAGKRELFARIAGVLRTDGRFVLGDVVVPPAGRQGPDLHRLGDGHAGQRRRPARLAPGYRLRGGGREHSCRPRRLPR